MLYKDDTVSLIARVTKNLGLYSPEAVSLIYNTGLVESGYRFLRQMGSGPARGFFQCEPWVAVDICNNYLKYRDKRLKKASSASNVYWHTFIDPNESDWDFILESNLAAQIVMCRLHYRRVPKPIPDKDDIPGQAEYWKKYYNTDKGRGTIQHFLSVVQNGKK